MQTQKVIQIDNNVQSSVPCALTVLSDPDSIFNIGQKNRWLRNVLYLSTICSIVVININVDIKYILIFSDSFMYFTYFQTGRFFYSIVVYQNI